jgi:hypothetical protein
LLSATIVNAANAQNHRPIGANDAAD